MKTRIKVLSERGRLIGVYVPPDTPPTDTRAPVARLVAGPGQKIQDMEVELAHAYKHAKEIDALHAVVRKKLKLRK
jgi:hypothetical protein